MKARNLIIAALIVLGFSFIARQAVFAQDAAADGVNTKTGPLLINCDVKHQNADGTITLTNQCTIDDFFNQFVYLAQFGLNIVSLLAIIMLIYGGIQWITAAGRSSKIDEGKRIVVGTLVGFAIAFTAYVIINFTMSAITGTTTRSFNPFGGPLATIFAGKQVDNKNIEQVFSGTGGTSSGTDSTSCNLNWDVTCSDQIYCADSSKTSGAVHDLQKALNEKGCSCGQEDGCFGNGTADCVRNFQLANALPPTGYVDQRTKTLALGAGNACNGSAAISDQVKSVSAKLPDFDVNTIVSMSPKPAATSTGCCVVKETNSSGTFPLYCTDATSERTCRALGSNNLFIPNESCALNATTSSICGFCLNYTSKTCFEQTSNYWCTSVMNPPVTFRSGVCTNNSECRNSSGINTCLQTLYTSF